jgi:hypothetical protein
LILDNSINQSLLNKLQAHISFRLFCSQLVAKFARFCEIFLVLIIQDRNQISDGTKRKGR